MRLLSTCLTALCLAFAASANGAETELVGQVLSAFDDWSFYLFDGTNVITANVRDPGRNSSRSGDRVHAHGKMLSDETGRRRFAISGMAVVGHASPPRTVETSGEQMFRGDVPSLLVNIRGVIASVAKDDVDPNWNWMILRTATRNICVATSEREYPRTDLLKLRDAEVVLRGSVSSFSDRRQYPSKILILFGEGGIEIIRPAPEDPFFVQASEHASLHRQRAKGIVLAFTPAQLFLRQADGQFLVADPTENQPAVSVGDSVEVVGFREQERFCVRFTDALVRILPGQRAPMDYPERLAPTQLFVDFYGRDRPNTGYNGRLIGFRGKIGNAPSDIRSAEHLRLDNERWSVMVDVTGIRNRLPPGLENGCLVDVTGICLAESDNNSTVMPFSRFHGFTLVPRIPEDLVIVKRPPWWTPFRLTMCVCALVIVLVVILIWNRALKVLSERRGRELAREQLRHAESELKVEERTRLAVELHDSISQTLTGVALQIDAAQGSAESPSVSGRFLDTARAMLASCRQELRCCIWDLKSRTFDESDMTEAVTRTLAPHLGETEAQVRFNVPRSILSESTAHDVLRIIRELAVNAIRHGQAKHLRIAGELRDGLVRFSVRDDGLGFDPHDIPGPAQGHFGLQGIRERISGRNGDMTVESVPGKGTKITVAFVPDEKDEDEP